MKEIKFSAIDYAKHVDSGVIDSIRKASVQEFINALAIVAKRSNNKDISDAMKEYNKYGLRFVCSFIPRYGDKPIAVRIACEIELKK